MPRANRHFLPGHIWHITHRCHKKEFLLKFDKDRENWKSWLFEAKKRYRIKILNYTVTSNHIHLLVFDEKGGTNIPAAIKLTAGSTAQSYNNRKKRKGAFWDDRYHATAVSKDEHLMKCMVYIDMNMVRAGAVNHPSQWKQTGFNEILQNKKRYTLIDKDALKNFFNFKDINSFQSYYNDLINYAIEKNDFKKKAFWADSIAVGNNEFIENFKNNLGILSKRKKIETTKDISYIKETENDFRTNIAETNQFVWDMHRLPL
jgi:REP element-mobilizing transposase RayT